MHTYELFVQGQQNEDKKRAAIVVIVVYIDSEMAYEAEIMALYCIEHQ